MTNCILKNTHRPKTIKVDALWRMHVFPISFPIEKARHRKFTSRFPAACILFADSPERCGRSLLNQCVVVLFLYGSVNTRNT